MNKRQMLGHRILTAAANWADAHYDGGATGSEEWGTLCKLVDLADAAERLALAWVRVEDSALAGDGAAWADLDAEADAAGASFRAALMEGVG